MSASSSGIGVNSASASAGGYSAGGTSKSGDVVANVGRVVGRGGRGKAVVSAPSADGADGGGTGTNASRGKKRVASDQIMPKNKPDSVSLRIPPDFEDTHGRQGSITSQGARLAKVTERDRDPHVQPPKRDVVQHKAPAIQIVGRLSQKRAGSRQKMCTFGSHRRTQNWTNKYRMQTMGPLSDHLPFKTRNDSTPSGVGSNLGV